MASSGDFQAISGAIKTLMDAESSLINVYDYDPFTTDWSTFLDHFEAPSGTPPQGWGISRDGCRISWEDSGHSVWVHQVVIRGWLAVNTSLATAKTIQVLADTVANIFCQDVDLGEVVELHHPAVIRRIEPRMFGGVLMHYAELAMECQELVTRS